MEKYIPLIVGGIFALFILVGLFWGLIRGLKKSTFRLSWILVCAVVLFFLTPIITKWVMGINLSFLNIKVNGVAVATITELVTVLLSNISGFGSILTKSPETVDMLLTLVTLFINAFVYVILFWVVKIVLWPIWSILALIFIKRKDAEGNKKPKHRLFGGIVGGFLGLFVGATTLMPVMGVFSIVNEVEKETSKTYTVKVVNAETGEEEQQTVTGGQITQLLGEDAMKYINAYSDSFVSKILKYTGVEFITNATYSGLSSATINENRIVLKDEVKTILKTVSSVNDLSNIDTRNLTKEQITQIITSAKTVVNNVFQLKILTVLGDNLYPLVMDEIINNPEFIIKLPNTGEQVFDEAITKGFNELSEITFSSIKNEVLAVLDIAEILNENDILVELLNEETASFQNISKLVSDEVVESVNDKLFSMQISSSIMPIVVNTSLKYVAETLDVTDFSVDEENGDAEAVKNLFKGITTTVFGIANSLDLESKYYITESTLPLAGKLLDSVKGYEGLTSENYKKLVNAVENKLVDSVYDMLNGFTDELEPVKTEVVNAVKRLSEVNNYENEFIKLNNVYNDIVEVVDGFSGEEKEIKLIPVGRVLDAIKNTELLGGAVNPIIKAGLNYAKTLVPVEFEDLKPILERVKNNVSSVAVWETEFTKLNEVVSVGNDVFNASDLKSVLLDDESETFSELGASFNTLNQTTLFNGEVKNVVKVLLGSVEDMEIDNSNMLSTTLTEIENNIDTAENIDWEAEFTVLKTLLNGLMDLASDSSTSESITATGKTFDNILKEDSVLINETVIKTIVCSTIEQYAGDVEEGSNLETVITTIKNGINNGNNLSYEVELTALNSIFNNIESINPESENFYSEFGAMLDSYDVTYGYYHSVVVSAARPDIVKLAISEVDTTQMDSEIVEIIEEIKNNVDSIETVDLQNKYKIEFEYLELFIEKFESLTSVDVETFNFGEFGTMLDAFNSSLWLKSVRSDVLVFICDKAQNSLTSTVSELSTAITEILENTKNLGELVEEGELTYNKIFEDFGSINDLIDSLESVNITRTDDGLLTIKTFGETLNDLQELCVVPTVAAVRIAEYITGEIIGDNGIKNIMPAGFESDPVLSPIYTTLVNEIQPINNAYNNYLENPDDTTFNFELDFTAIYNKVIEADNALTAAGFGR